MGKRFHVASASPDLSAEVSFHGLYLLNEDQVRIWPCARASGEHTIDIQRRLSANFPNLKPIIIWHRAAYPRAKAVWSAAASLDIHNPDLMPVEPLWRWLREDVTYHHCHAAAEDLTRRVASFEAAVDLNPHAVADRL